VQEAVHPEANIIFGAVIDDTLGDEVRVTVIAAGFDGGEPQTRIEPITSARVAPIAPAVPTTPADEVAKDLDKEPVSVSVAADTTYDSAFGDDDLDIPDFLK
jgi:cell division protein FtsZ